METNLKFNSAICTSRSQSERLLALGLKKETADMVHCIKTRNHLGDEIERHSYYSFGTEVDERPLGYANYEHFPAWSLGRLIEMMPEEIDRYFCTSFLILSKHNVYYNESVDGAPDMEFEKNNLFESILNCIEWLIKEGYFNNEYLEE